MPESVTLNVTNGTNKETKPFTFNVQNKQFINSIITVGDNNTITKEQMQQLQGAAARGGDLGVLESCDLNPQNKIKLAELRGFSEYYDINLSDDGKFFEVKIKDAGKIVKNPNLGTIKHDFGVRDGVFVKYDNNGNYEYPNNEFLKDRKPPVPKENYTDIDKRKLEVDDVLRIPVEEININSSPRGFLGRLVQ